MNWQERAEKAEAELARLAKQKPVTYVIDFNGYAINGKHTEIAHALPIGMDLYAAPVPAAADPRLHPEWKGRNSYGLDMDYFRRKLEQVLRDLDRYTPEEFARAMAVHSRTADATVIPREFVPAVAAPAVPKRCYPCNSTGALHCSDPENCGGPWDTHCSMLQSAQQEPAAADKEDN